ncbi:MAG: DAK2 domain-containing protein [Rectinema sp.]
MTTHGDFAHSIPQDVAEAFEALRSTSAYLSRHASQINNLNVFPVPDGDTGLNLTLTLQGALQGIKAKMQDGTVNATNAGEFLKDFANELLLHSRGCSGVIFALFCKGVAEKLANNDFSNKNILAALENGYKSAWEGTFEPKEGTMLTMMRAFAEEFRLHMTSMPEQANPKEIIQECLPKLKDVLNKTPEMLPVLKEAGVVDSGAAGFLIILEGLKKSAGVLPVAEGNLAVSRILSINRALRRNLNSILASLRSGNRSRLHRHIGIPLEDITNPRLRAGIENILRFQNLRPQAKEKKQIKKNIKALDETWDGDIRYRFCTEFVLNTPNTNVTKQQLNALLARYGDSIIVLDAPAAFKVHVHTNQPEEVLKTISSFGTIGFSKVDDMKKQHKNFISHDTIKYEKENSIFCIVSGEGFEKIVLSLGADDVYDYGRNKPSVDRLVEEINRLHAKNVIAAADDSDILMSLKYAASLSKSNVRVIECGSMPSIIGMLTHTPRGFDINTTAEMMMKNLDAIGFCKISRVVREAKTEEGELIHKGDFCLIANKRLLAGATSPLSLLDEAIARFGKDSELVTVYRGKSMKNKPLLDKSVTAAHKDLTLEEYYGGQFNCDFLVTFE